MLSNSRLLLRVVGHLAWLSTIDGLCWSGVGQASGEETAGSLGPAVRFARPMGI